MNVRGLLGVRHEKFVNKLLSHTHGLIVMSSGIGASQSTFSTALSILLTLLDTSATSCWRLSSFLLRSSCISCWLQEGAGEAAVPGWLGGRGGVDWGGGAAAA